MNQPTKDVKLTIRGFGDGREFEVVKLISVPDNDYMKPEGIVLRNADRSKIVKLRFEDYQRTLRR